MYIDFVHQLYRFIAHKVAFSSDLPLRLAEKNAPFGNTCQQLARELDELKKTYYRLWLANYKPDGVFNVIMKFSHLAERFHYIQQLATQSQSRLELIAKLQSYDPTTSAGGIHFSDLFYS